MDRVRALQVLGLAEGFELSELEASYDARQRQLNGRFSTASSDGLRGKYRQQLEELQEAHGHLTQVLHDAEFGFDRPTILPGQQRPGSFASGDDRSSMLERIGIAQGDVLSGRYEVRRRVGVGGMGAVYAAYDRNRDKEIALKVMLPGLVSSDKARERLLAEGRVASELSHPRIVNVFDVQFEGPYYFLTMELLAGRTLREEMEDRRKTGRAFTVEEALRLGASLSEALSYAHRYTVHRDVKPENVFLCRDGTIKLMDFGIARLFSSTQLTMTGVSMGTAYYMAPEQLRAERGLDGRADQYSVAVVLYEMLTGQVPAGMVQPLSVARRDAPTALAAAVERALSPNPAARFANMDEFAAALTGAGTGKRLPAWAWQAAAAVLLLLGGAGVGWLLMGNRDGASVAVAPPIHSDPVAVASKRRDDLADNERPRDAAAAVPDSPAAPAAPAKAQTGQPDAIASPDAAKSAADADARQAEAERKKADADRKQAETQKAAAAAAEAKQAAADAKKKAEAEADAEKKKVEADRKQAQAKADADARKQAEEKARLEARAKADAEAEGLASRAQPNTADEDPTRLAARPTPAELPPPDPKALLAKAHAFIFNEPTDGNRGGGSWGVCWRPDSSAARTCAESSCNQKRKSAKVACVQTASSGPGEYCAVARASGFGVSTGACEPTASRAESSAIAKCGAQVSRYYEGSSEVCKVVWSSAREQ